MKELEIKRWRKAVFLRNISLRVSVHEVDNTILKTRHIRIVRERAQLHKLSSSFVGIFWGRIPRKLEFPTPKPGHGLLDNNDVVFGNVNRELLSSLEKKLL
jgi:hypothetical protein